VSTKGFRWVASMIGAGEQGEAAPLGSGLLPARHRVRGFHLEEEGGAARLRARLDTEAELGRLGGRGPDLAVSITASWVADLLDGNWPARGGLI